MYVFPICQGKTLLFFEKFFIKIEICLANFYRNIPQYAEYFTRAKREYHVCLWQIYRMLLPKATSIYRIAAGNISIGLAIGNVQISTKNSSTVVITSHLPLANISICRRQNIDYLPFLSRYLLTQIRY